MELNGAQQTTLVLLPGLDGTGKLFRPFIAALPDSVRIHVVAYPPDALWTLNEYADYVANQLPHGRIVLLAESFSGLVALALLAARSPRLDAVVFCASFAEPPRPWLLRFLRVAPDAGGFVQAVPDFLLRLCCAGRHADATQVALVRTAVSEVAPRVLASRIRMVATERASAIPFKVRCHYLQATNDRLVPAGAARWFERYFETFRLEKVEGPHFLLQTRARECAGRVMRILKEVEDSSRKSVT